MSYRIILTPVEVAAAANYVSVATSLAREQAATLVGLHVMPPSAPSTEYGFGLTPTMLAEIERMRRDAAKAAEGSFRDVASTVPGARFEIDDAGRTMDPESVVCRRARTVDITVVPQIGAGERLEDAPGSLAERLVMESGRPVIVVPQAGRFSTVGRRVLVAWNRSRESARAVADAMPLLERAEEVWVLTIDETRSARGVGRGNNDDRAAQAVEYLALHGIKAKPCHDIVGDITAGDILLSRVSDMGIDLLVLGAYGHSRLRESMLGGVTREILQHMTVPTLMSH